MNNPFPDKFTITVDKDIRKIRKVRKLLAQLDYKWGSGFRLERSVFHWCIEHFAITGKKVQRATSIDTFDEYHYIPWDRFEEIYEEFWRGITVYPSIWKDDYYERNY